MNELNVSILNNININTNSLDARNSVNLYEAKHKPGSWLDGRSRFLITTSSSVTTRHKRQQQQHSSHSSKTKRSSRENYNSNSNNNKFKSLIGTLRIESVSSEDNGIYSCRVEYKKARSRIQEYLVRIIG